MEERRGGYTVLVKKAEGRTKIGRSRRRWEDNIKKDLRKVGWGHRLDRSGLGQGQVAGCCECGSELSGSIKCGEFPDYMRTC